MVRLVCFWSSVLPLSPGEIQIKAKKPLKNVVYRISCMRDVFGDADGGGIITTKTALIFIVFKTCKYFFLIFVKDTKSS